MFFLIVRAYLYIRKKNQREKRNLSKVCSKISDVEMQNFFDEVDGEEITKDANGQYWFGERPFKFHVEFVQPSLYRVILTWAFIELCMMSYVLLRFKEGYPENFLNGFCSAYRCKSYMPKFMSYKIFSAVLLAIGGQKVNNSQIFAHFCSFLRIFADF